MSAQSVLMDSEASSQSSDSGPEGPGISQVSRKPKRRKSQCKAWNFQYTLRTDILGEEGVTTHEKTTLLREHLQTRLGHKKPHAVHSVTVFCDFKSMLSPSTDVPPVPRRFGRQPRLSAVHEPCREHCRAMVQAFRVGRARIKQCRPQSGARKSKGIPQTRLPRPSVSNSSPGRLTEYSRAGGGGSRASGTSSSSKSSEKTSSVRE